MTPDKLDALFPYVVLAYGALLTVALHSEKLTALGARYIPEEAWNRLQGHRRLAAICLGVGALWTLQNLLFI